MRRRFLPLLLVLLFGACRLPGLGSSGGPSDWIREVSLKTPVVYYGPATCGATAAVLELTLDPNAPTPARVGVQYRLTGAQDWQQVDASLSGPGTYMAVVPVPATAANAFQNQPGRLEYRAFVADAQGQTAYSPAQGTHTLEVQPCTQAAVAPGQDTTPPTIQQVLTSSPTVFYAGACVPNTLTFTATVVDDSGQLQQVAVEYWLERNGQAVTQPHRQAMRGVGSVYQWTVSAGSEIARALGNQAGALAYRILATDMAGNTATYPTAGQTARVTLQPCQANASGGSNANAGGANRNPAAPPAGRPANPPAGQPPAGNPGNNPNPPAGGAANPPAGSASLAIVDVLTDPQDTVYYGACQAGEPTWLEIMVQVNDIQRVAAAQVFYRYEDANQAAQGFPYTAAMARQQGIGDYTASIDVAADLGQQSADWLVYYVEVTGTDGQKVTSPTYYIDLTPCPVTGQPPAPPAEPRIIGAAINPERPAVGNACPAGASTLTFEVVVDPPDAVAELQAVVAYVPTPNVQPQYLTTVNLTPAGGSTFRGSQELNALFPSAPPQGTYLVVTFVLRSVMGTETTSSPQYVDLDVCVAPTITYFTVFPDNIQAGDSYTVEWEVSDATCGVYLDTQLVDPVGNMTFTTTSSDAGTITHTLYAYGGACDTPVEVSDTVSVEVRPASNVLHKGTIYMYLDDSFDLDQDGYADIYLEDQIDAWAFTPLGDTWFIPLESTAIVSDMNANLEECIARFMYEPGAAVSGVTVEVDMGVCVRTATGKIGYFTVNFVDPAQGLLEMSFISESTQ